VVAKTGTSDVSGSVGEEMKTDKWERGLQRIEGIMRYILLCVGNGYIFEGD
jgi:hypothetical protein